MLHVAIKKDKFSRMEGMKQGVLELLEILLNMTFIKINGKYFQKLICQEQGIHILWSYGKIKWSFLEELLVL
jgi:hypothetical protein